jgi:mannosyl-oligosaccharide alpha-1,2-mannosidase
VFETTIRALGGLCAAYDLSGDAMFLRKADELAGTLAWAFNTSAGIPYASLNFASCVLCCSVIVWQCLTPRRHQGRSPGWTGGSSILAEIGTLQLEFKHVAHHTGNMYYYKIVRWYTSDEGGPGADGVHVGGARDGPSR